MDPRKLKFLVTGAVIVTAMVALFTFSLTQSGAAYYVSVSEYADGMAVDFDNCRVNGKVLPGSIDREAGGMELDFVMTDGTATLPVHYRGVVPDTFVDDSDVVVEGDLGPDGRFVAHTLLAKCPSKYEAAPAGAETAGGVRPSEGSPNEPASYPAGG